MEHLLREMDRKLDEIIERLQGLKIQGEIMANTLDDDLALVTQESTVDDSIIALLNSLAAQIAAAGGNQAKIDAIFNAATANIAKISSAVTANTPAAPTATAKTAGPAVASAAKTVSAPAAKK